MKDDTAKILEELVDVSVDLRDMVINLEARADQARYDCHCHCTPCHHAKGDALKLCEEYKSVWYTGTYEQLREFKERVESFTEFALPSASQR